MSAPAAINREFGRFVGSAPVMHRLYQEIELYASSDERVLILGETGTGKMLAALEIRDRSPRRKGPLVVLNCAGFDHSLIERELFGHVKGAFTGAIESKKGLFDAADGGTLLLDEAGCMSQQLQGRLLDVLETGCVRRVGSPETRKVDVRVLAATNKDLGQRVAAGAFREDLFWRLAVGILSLPPLRDHREDIPRLIEHFAHQCVHASSSEGNGEPLQFSPETIETLVSAEWPGNVRQLDYMIHWISMRHTDRSKPVGHEMVAQQLETLGARIGTLRGDRSSLATLQDVEEKHVRRVLETTRGNAKRAAEILGIGRSTLYRKLESYNIWPSRSLPERGLTSTPVRAGRVAG